MNLFTDLGIDMLKPQKKISRRDAGKELKIVMTKQEIVNRLRKAYECEAAFPGVRGNPRVFAGRWGLFAARTVKHDRDKAKSKLAPLKHPSLGVRYHIVRVATDVKKSRIKRTQNRRQLVAV